ncbi:EamA family transporter RarD [Nocardioides sp.]|uniref:EamA family transporter RarD n=1 Tax=Nocardioides sp. TaxID=35761 RepID=UPI0035188D78
MTSSSARGGLAYGVAAYLIWGAFPLYWPLLEPSGPVEILAHRVLWSVLVMLALVALTRRTAQLRALAADRRTRSLLALAALTITSNWAMYIYGVNSGRVVETSLGYFINPLVTVLMGVVVLRERLRPAQWAALGVGGLAVVVLTVDYGRPPWIALVLAFSFGTYGLAKKAAGVEPVESLTFETLLIAPFAAVFLLALTLRGDGTAFDHGLDHALLLPTTGLVTAIPLILFGAAAVRVSMVNLGLLQYLAPVLQFLLGLTVFDETMTTGRWIGFTLVWAALVIFTLEALRHHRRALQVSAEASLAV